MKEATKRAARSARAMLAVIGHDGHRQHWVFTRGNRHCDGAATQEAIFLVISGMAEGQTVNLEIRFDASHIAPE